MVIPQHTCEAFDNYLQFVQTKEIVLSSAEGLLANSRSQYRELLDLYLFGRYAQNLAVCNKVVDMWREAQLGSSVTPSEEQIQRISGTLFTGDPLVRLCVAQICNISPKDRFCAFIDSYEWPVGFLKELSYHYYDLLDGEKPRVRDRESGSTRCLYHRHNDQFPSCT